MSDEAALLRGILEAPGDDAPRLVYADWLEERAGEVACPSGCRLLHGEHRRKVYQAVGPDSRWEVCDRCHGTGRIPNGYAERAEFIRVQCELARWTDSDGYMPMGLGREELRRREAYLVRGWGHDWASMPTLGGGMTWMLQTQPATESVFEHPHFVFRRGFISAIALPCAAFMQHAADLFAKHPIERVTLTDKRPQIDSGRQNGYRWWRELILPIEASNLPSAIFNLIEPGYNVSPDYPTESLACAAMSQACVNFGRSLVVPQLPPLSVATCAVAGFPEQ